MPTAFVTGATGFLGLNLVATLRARGFDVTALHRAGSDLTYLTPMGATLKVGTVEDLSSVRAAMPEAVDVVFHAAASLSWWRRRAKAQYATNVTGTRNVAQAALERGARRFVHTSSVAAFGFQDGLVTEATPSTAAASPIGYLRTKHLAEVEVRAAVAHGLPAVIVNPANIIGPYDRASWGRAFRLVAQGRLPGVAPGAGDFCHVAKVVDAHLAAAQRGEIGANYILGGAHATYLEVFRGVAELLGKRFPTKPVSAWVLRAAAYAMLVPALFSGKEPDLTPDLARVFSRNMSASSAKAERALGYDTSPTLRQMLGDCHAWLVQEKLLD